MEMDKIVHDKKLAETYRGVPKGTNHRRQGLKGSNDQDIRDDRFLQPQAMAHHCKNMINNESNSNHSIQNHNGWSNNTNNNNNNNNDYESSCSEGEDYDNDKSSEGIYILSSSDEGSELNTLLPVIDVKMVAKQPNGGCERGKNCMTSNLDTGDDNSTMNSITKEYILKFEAKGSNVNNNNNKEARAKDTINNIHNSNTIKGSKKNLNNNDKSHHCHHYPQVREPFIINKSIIRNNTTNILNITNKNNKLMLPYYENVKGAEEINCQNNSPITITTPPKCPPLPCKSTGVNKNSSNIKNINVELSSFKVVNEYDRNGYFSPSTSSISWSPVSDETNSGFLVTTPPSLITSTSTPDSYQQSSDYNTIKSKSQIHENNFGGGGRRLVDEIASTDLRFCKNLPNGYLTTPSSRVNKTVNDSKGDGCKMNGKLLSVITKGDTQRLTKTSKSIVPKDNTVSIKNGNGIKNILQNFENRLTDGKLHRWPSTQDLGDDVEDFQINQSMNIDSHGNENYNIDNDDGDCHYATNVKNNLADDDFNEVDINYCQKSKNFTQANTITTTHQTIETVSLRSILKKNVVEKLSQIGCGENHVPALEVTKSSNNKTGKDHIPKAPPPVLPIPVETFENSKNPVVKKDVKNESTCQKLHISDMEINDDDKTSICGEEKLDEKLDTCNDNSGLEIVEKELAKKLKSMDCSKISKSLPISSICDNRSQAVVTKTNGHKVSNKNDSAPPTLESSSKPLQKFRNKPRTGAGNTKYNKNGSSHNINTNGGCKLADNSLNIYEDDNFVGIRDVTSKPIFLYSLKGTVRGVHNRVLEVVQNFVDANMAFKRKLLSSEKVVLYTTSCTAVRETYLRSKSAKALLKAMLVRYEERDCYINDKWTKDLKILLKGYSTMLPQIFVNGHNIGGYKELEKLNEAGELKDILERYKAGTLSVECVKCGDFHFVLCSHCHGSKRSSTLNVFTEGNGQKASPLKCAHCEETGLVRCDNCYD